MRIGIYLLIAVAMICSARGNTNEQIRTLVNGNDDFAVRLYQELAKTTGNVIFSPFSISTALAMTSAGADGTTLEEMRKVLALGPAGENCHDAFALLVPQIAQTARNSGVALCIRNSIWLREDIQPEPVFKAIVVDKYRAELFKVDFVNNGGKVSGQINVWIQKATAGRIGGMIGRDFLLNPTPSNSEKQAQLRGG